MIVPLVLLTASLPTGFAEALDLERVTICRVEVRTPRGEEWPILRWGAESVDLYLQLQEPVSMDLAAADRLMRGDLELLSQLTQVSNSTGLDPSVQLDVCCDKGSLTVVQSPLMFRLPEGTPLQNEWPLGVTRGTSSSRTLNTGELSGTLDLT